jgi:hypothetical protein
MQIENVTVFYADAAQEILSELPDDAARAKVLTSTEEWPTKPGRYWQGRVEGAEMSEGPSASREEAQADVDHYADSPRPDEIADRIAERIGLRPKSSRSKQ